MSVLCFRFLRDSDRCVVSVSMLCLSFLSTIERSGTECCIYEDTLPNLRKDFALSLFFTLNIHEQHKQLKSHMFFVFLYFSAAYVTSFSKLLYSYLLLNKLVLVPEKMKSCKVIMQLQDEDVLDHHIIPIIDHT